MYAVYVIEKLYIGGTCVKSLLDICGTVVERHKFAYADLHNNCA